VRRGVTRAEFLDLLARLRRASVPVSRSAAWTKLRNKCGPAGRQRDRASAARCAGGTQIPQFWPSRPARWSTWLGG